MPKSNASKEDSCQVCGDNGVGIKYGVFSCLSCKTFFHRNAAKIGHLKCRKFGNCSIDISTRKSCGSCRLKKCAQVGMQFKVFPKIENDQWPEFQSESHSKAIKIEKILENKIKKMVCQTEIPFSKENNFCECNSIDVSTRKRKYAFDLNASERNCIRELERAMSVFNDEKTLPSIGPMSSLEEAFNWPANYSRKIIQFCKRMPAFTLLQQNDQLTMIKKCYMELLSVRTSFAFELDKNGYRVLANDTGTKTMLISYDHPLELAEKFNHSEILEINRQINVSLFTVLENDINLRNLLSGYFLFYPREKLQCQEFVRYNFCKYSRLLLRYLEHKYRNIHLATKKYNEIFKVIKQFDKLKECNVQLIEFADSSTFSDLSIELFDISNYLNK